MKQKITNNERTTALWAKIHVRLLLALLVGLLTGTGTAWADGTTNVALGYSTGSNNNWKDIDDYHQYYCSNSGERAVLRYDVDLKKKSFTDTQLDGGDLNLFVSIDFAAYDGGVGEAIIKVECATANYYDDKYLVTGNGARTYLLNLPESTAFASNNFRTYGMNIKLPSGTRYIHCSVFVKSYNSYNMSGPKVKSPVIKLITSSQSVSHNIKVSALTKGTITTSATSPFYKEVGANYTSAPGYYMSACNMTYKDTNGSQIQALKYDRSQTSGTTTFIMPDADVTINPTFTPWPTITTGTLTHGSLTVDKASLPDKEVSVSYTSDPGYYMSACSMTYTDDFGSHSSHTLPLTYDKLKTSGTMTFKMPAANTTINATFTPIPTINVSGGNVDITAPANALPGSTVTFDVKPHTGYIGSVSYTYGSNTTILATDVWYPQTLTFTMPENNVTINGSFTPTNTSTTLTVNIPKTGTLAINIPAAYKSLKIYDDGGASGDYSAECDGTLELTAPVGKMINLYGTLTVEQNKAHLYYYDGMSAKTFMNPYNNNTLNINTVTTANNASLRFASKYTEAHHSGIDLNVRLYSESENHTITMADEATKAVVKTSVSKEYADRPVTLNVTPTNGYVGSVSYKTANGVEKTLATGIFCQQTLTFAMPASDVTICSSFAPINASSDLIINMPVSGTISANIPAVYHSLKIYDDGGPSGKQSKDCDGSLLLTAPDNYVIHLTGNIYTQPGDIQFTYRYNKDGTPQSLVVQPGNTQISCDVTTNAANTVLHLYGYTSSEYDGIDLSVSLIYKGSPIAVTPDATMTIDGNTAPGYWATLYTEAPRTIPTGVTAYYIQDGTTNDAYAKLVKLTGTVLPAGNGYLLNCATASTPLSFAYTETVATDNVTGNLLKGGATATTDNESGYLYYILGRIGTSPNYTYGFYWQNSASNGGVTDGTKVVSAAYKAYLKVPHTTGGAKSMALTFGDGTTGISNTAVSAQENGAWYTLQGVRLTAEPTQRGIYIHNKKKVIIK